MLTSILKTKEYYIKHFVINLIFLLHIHYNFYYDLLVGMMLYYDIIVCNFFKWRKLNILYILTII